MSTGSNRTKAWLLAAAAAAGIAVGAAGIAGAATDTPGNTTGNATGSAASSAAPDPTKMANGPGETLLTGDASDKAKAAALAAVPGATIIRVETDSAGSPYEAHVTKSNGSQVTLKLDANFAVTATENGFGGPGPQGGQAPASSGSTSA